MLRIIKSMKELDFSGLMAVYAGYNLETGREQWPREPESRQMMLAEEAYFNYLSQVFFRTPGAACLIWQEDGGYVSALRLEPYRDGLLLAALETAPEHRQKGYAKQLVQAAQAEYGGAKIYSHVDKRNIASRKIHESCGFEKILDHAVYADGSVLQSSVTYCYE